MYYNIMKIKQGKGLLAHINWINSPRYREHDSKGKFLPVPKRVDPMSLEGLVQRLNAERPYDGQTVIYTGIEGMNKLNEVMNIKDENNI